MLSINIIIIIFSKYKQFQRDDKNQSKKQKILQSEYNHNIIY